MDTKSIAQSVYKRHNTRDPFTISNELDYSIINTHLVDIRGFYQRVNQCHIIYIDESLDEVQARFVCAHELGHSLMHSNLNRIYMDTRTYEVSSRYEKEADRFAADLLFDDYDLQELLNSPISAVAEYLGISRELATYRMDSVLLSYRK